MTYLRDISLTSFVMLRANSMAGDARELLDTMAPTHLIICGMEPQDTYYLLTADEAAALLQGKAAETLLADALRQAGTAPCPVLDAYAAGETAPLRAVLEDDGHIVGLVDATVPPDALEGAWEESARGERGIGGIPDPGEVDFGPGMEPPPAPLPSAGGGVPGEPVSRAVVTEFPERVKQGATKTLKVALSADVEASPLVVSRPLGTKILIVVEPEGGFEVVGDEEGELIVTSEQQTMALRFKLRATTLGLGKIRVYAYEGVQPVGRMVVAATIVPPHEEEDAMPTERRQELPSVRVAQPGPEPSVRVHQPDLVLFINQKGRGPHSEYSMQLKARDEKLELEPFALAFEADPEEYFQQFFTDIQGPVLNSADEPREAELRLETKGADLFTKAFPEVVQTMLWDLRYRIKTVQILSDEPWIPWEMCRFQGQEEGTWTTGPFLCEAYQVTRWMRAYEAKPLLTLNRMAIVVPEDSGLDYAEKEKRHLLSLANDGRQVTPIPARFVPLYSALSSGEYDGWHFTGHGQAREEGYPKSSIELEEYSSLSPENLAGDARNLGKAKPLVFLNACQAGRGEVSLTDVGGFAAKFLWAGAGAFVGALWKIKDDIAYEFAIQFYDRLLKGKAIGQATRESRLKIKEDHPGDPTWLAYTVYADPFATVQA